MTKRILTIFLALCLLLPVTAAAADASETFRDVGKDDWFYDAVNLCLDRHLFEGTAADTFSPASPLTREMFVTVLYRYAAPADNGWDSVPFSDVKSGSWYEKAVMWAYDTKIVGGISDTLFGTGMVLTREQAATMLVRYLEEGCSYTLAPDAGVFADAGDVSAFASAAVEKVKGAGLMRGQGNNLFAPKKQMTRSEAAMVFANLIRFFAEHVHTPVTETKYIPATGGIQSRTVTTCAVCSEVLSEGNVENGRLPVLELSGDMTGISKDNTVTMQASYNAADQTFDSYCTIKWQGASSIAYEKKNYNLKLFKDQTAKEKNKVNVGWGKENKYCLKANYIDYTQSHNLVSAKLWGDVVRSRAAVPAELQNLVNGGAVDGYPVLLYINKEYQGLYTFNIPKDKWMLEDGDHDIKGIVVTNDWSDACNFLDFASPSAESWEIEENAEDSDDWLWERLNGMIGFVRRSTGDSFRQGIGDYLDVDSYIDYMIFVMAGTMRDNTAKNMMFATYDGQKFYVNMYDMDTSWGLFWDGSKLYDPSMLVPRVVGSSVSVSEVNNLLWSRMFDCYAPRIRARYLALRAETLSTENILQHFRDYSAMIPAWAIDAEKKLYPRAPGFTSNTFATLSDHVTKHMELLDAAMAKLRIS